MKIKIATVPYEELDFVWISNHWDIHLNGLCNYKNNLCEFKTKEGEYDWEKEEYIIPTTCDIYSLSLVEKIKWLSTKKKFELMVGYHWTYPYRKTRERPFHYRKPKWLYKWLFSLFYKNRKCCK